MAQKLTTAFVNTVIPDAYVETTVKSTPSGISSTGGIVIIGEAAGGADYTTETLEDNVFTADQLDRVKAKYLSGPIVDAMSALVSPSNDSEISGSASKVYIVKTNGGTKASSVVTGDAGAYGTFSAKNYGIDGNKYFYQITESEAEVGPSSEGTAITTGALNGIVFHFRPSGGVITIVTLAAEHANAAAVIADIDSQLPAGYSCVAGTISESIKFESDTDAGAKEDGFGKSFELIDVDALTKLGHSVGLYVSSQEPEIEISIKRQDTNTNELFTVDAEVALTIGYTGTSGTLSVSSGVLTTTVVGGSGANLSITLSEYSTLQDLAGYISAQTGYTATAIAASNNSAPTSLDEVTAMGIAVSGAVEAGRIKKSANKLATTLADSAVLDFAFTLSEGLPLATTGAVYLAGGLKGATTSADIVSAIPSLEGIKVNFVLPLFSQDATVDISEGTTDSASTYTIDAINFAIKTHVLAMSTVKVKRNRIAMLSKWDTYANIKTHAQTLSSYRAVLCFQKTSQVDSAGNVQTYLPWHTAAIAAGMQSAGFYKSLTNKAANIISLIDPTGFDSGNQGDVSDAIIAGTMFLQNATAGARWVVDQTSYGFDTNFVYNSLQASYMADVLSISLGDALKTFIVGKSSADIDAAGIKAFVAKKMAEYKKLKIIGASSDAPLGYKNLTVNVNAPIAEINVEAKLASAILFVPVQLELSSIQSSASA